MQELENLNKEKRKLQLDYIAAKDKLRAHFNFVNCIKFGVAFKKLDDVQQKINKLELWLFRNENE